MAPPVEVIDLVSDSEDEEPAPVPAAGVVRLEATPEEDRDLDGGAQFDEDDFFADYYPMPGQFDGRIAMPGIGDLANVPLVIDDFGYLDEEPQQQAGADQEQRDLELARSLDAGQVLSQDDCLARVIEVFPDVCPKHTLTLYDQIGEESEHDLPAAVRLDRIIEKLLANALYPKRKKEPQQLKRKREGSVDDDKKRWEGADREGMPRHLAGSIRSILKAEFPTFTHISINQIVNEEVYLYKSYIRVANLRDTDPTVRRGRAPMIQSNADTIAENSGWPALIDELAAARKRAQADRTLRLEEATTKRVEDDNLQRAIASGQTAECQACFDELPMNRQVHCAGETPHFSCFTCIETYIKTEIGDSRCRVMCTAGCGSSFEPAQLNLLADKKLLQKLADLQQEKDIRDAELEDLEDCPFCDYKAIMPPIEVNFEFTCANPECEKVSCRRCKATSHIPISCEQYAKDKKANSRHTIEEAMTAALIRSCNKCKKQFIKDYGCNKMTCPSCQNVQCYICSETLKGYEHFSQHPGGEARLGGKCPLYDNLEERHEREVKAAEDAARAQVVANNPDVTAEDLEIKMSDAVKNATADRIRRAGPEGLGGGPLGWGGGGMGGGLAAIFGDGADNDDDDEPAVGGIPHFGHRHHARILAARAHAAGRAAAQQQAQRLNANVLHAAVQARRMRLPAARAVDHAQPRPNPDHNQNVPNAVLAQPPMAAPFADFGPDNIGLFNVGDDLPWPRGHAGMNLAPNPPPLNMQLQGQGNPPYLNDEYRQIPQPPPFRQQRQQQHEQQLQPLRLRQAQEQLLLQRQQQQAAQNAQHPLPFQRGPVPDGFAPRANDQRHAMIPMYMPPQQPAGYAYGAAAYQPIPDMPLNAAGLANVRRNLHQLEYMRQQHDARNGNFGAPGIGWQPNNRGVARRAA